MSEFVIPDFLQGQSPEEIHQEMIEQIPSDIDMSLGGHPYNYTYPTAYTIAMFVQFRLTEAIKMITPQHCHGYDEMAEDHGETRGMTRKEAIAATGKIEVGAKAGTVIPTGSIFSTASINGVASVDFQTTEEVTYETDTTKSISIEAVIPGAEGNVQPNTIIVKTNDVDGITSVNNSTATTGGMKEESLDDFIDRMVKFDQKQGESYVGNDADYKRWAEEVEGVGQASIKQPTTDDGMITIIISDQNGDPAAPKICADVFNHIMNPTPLSKDGTQPEGMTTGLNRLAPPNAYICVTAPKTVNPTIYASVQINTDLTTLDEVKTAFTKALQQYFLEATEYIRMSTVGALLKAVKGVVDYDITSLRINGQTNNVPIESDTRPVITESNITLVTY